MNFCKLSKLMIDIKLSFYSRGLLTKRNWFKKSMISARFFRKKSRLFMLFLSLSWTKVFHFSGMLKIGCWRDDYDNLVVAKRNDHSNFEDLEGNLRGEILVTKLGDVFELLHMIKKISLPQTEVEEYINLEILSIQMKDLMLPTKNLRG